jgi:ACR3 family arsenite transporter
MQKDDRRLDFFSRYLTVWVAVCITLGTLLGNLFPGAAQAIGSFEVANVSIPVALVLLVMMYPIMLKIDFNEILQVREHPSALWLTLAVNWAIKPFTMAALAALFMRVFYVGLIPAQLQTEYIAGMILLGLAPCTAMVLVWTFLARANVNQALVQVSVNDLIILFLFAPLGKLLLGVTTNLPIPFATIFYSVLFYVAVPLGFAVITRRLIVRGKGEEWLEQKVIKPLEPITQVGLLVTLILVFVFQGQKIVTYPLHIVLIAIPLVLQTYLIFGIGYVGARWLKIPYGEAAPATMIGASNFFELSIATALVLYGMNSGAALATVVGVLTEVPVMLSLVAIMKARRGQFDSAALPTRQENAGR